MNLGDVTLLVPYTPGTGGVLANNLPSTVLKMDAIPNQATLISRGNLARQTTYAITSLAAPSGAAGNRIGLGAVLFGLDQAYAPGDLVLLQAAVPVGSGTGTVTSISAGAGLSGGTITGTGTLAIAAGAANTLAGFGSGGAFGTVSLGTNLTLSGGVLNATGGGGGGSGVVNSGTGGQLAGYPTTGTSVGGFTIGAGLSLTGSTLAATAVGTVNSGTTNQLGYFAGSGTTISPLTLGSGLSISGGTITATGSGTVNTGTTGTLAGYTSGGTAVSPLTLGTGLSLSGTTLNATATGTVGSGASGQLSYYAGAGTALAPLTVGTGLAITGSTLAPVGSPISGLTVLSAPTTGATVVILDPTDTTQASTGTTKQITVPNLLTGVGVAGTSGQIQYNNGGASAGLTMSGDATIVASTGVITVTKTGGTAFAASATTNTTVASNITSGTLPAARLPTPTASTLGGVQSYVAVAHQWINAISTSGVPGGTQPAFADISGSVAAAQLPNPTASTLGGVQSAVAVANQFMTGISTAGVPIQAQPTFANLSGTATAAQLPTTGLTITQSAAAIGSATPGATVTFALNTNNWWQLVLGQNTALLVSGATVGQTFFLEIQQAASGGPYTISSWLSGSTVVWFGPGFAAPSMPTSTSAWLSVMLRCVATSTYHAWWTGNSAT
jgi:hypothetical protein